MLLAACAGIPLGRAEITPFPDGELCVQVKEDVQGAQVFLVQPTSSSAAILELLLLADALKRCRPRRLVLIVPYFGYSRQERRTGRSPVSAEVMARLLRPFSRTESPTTSAPVRTAVLTATASSTPRFVRQ